MTYQHPHQAQIRNLSQGVIPLDHVAYVGSITSYIQITPHIVLLLFTKRDKGIPYYKAESKQL